MQMITDMVFSAGPRTCIGKHLALLEAKVALIKFVKRFKKIHELSERYVNFGLVTHFQNTQVLGTKNQ